jgi:NAD(P)-dependent dehydrogenase (short-subunit alcohol dehydrogenase family)
MSKAALVTGAGKRIGRAIAVSLARDGFSLAVHYNRSREEAEEVVAEIVSAGGRAAAVGANLSDEAETTSLVERAAGLVGPIVALVNNASTFEYDTPETATRATWDLHMEANLRAPFVLTQEFARRLPEGEEGAVVNVLDQRVWNLSPHFTTYTVSKAGLWTLTRTLALALAPRIRVNAVGPGPTLPSTHQTPEQFAAQCASMPLGRGATPEDVCDAIRYLLSARAVTGQMIAVDGGQHLGWATPRPDTSGPD